MLRYYALHSRSPYSHHSIHNCKTETRASTFSKINLISRETKNNHKKQKKSYCWSTGRSNRITQDILSRSVARERLASSILPLPHVVRSHTRSLGFFAQLLLYAFACSIYVYDLSMCTRRCNVEGIRVAWLDSGLFVALGGTEMTLFKTKTSETRTKLRLLEHAHVPCAPLEPLLS